MYDFHWNVVCGLWFAWDSNHIIGPADSIPTRVVYPDQDKKSCQDTRVHPESADSLLSWDPLRTAVFTRILHLPGYSHRLLLAHCKLNQVPL